jgi:excisionase family DNA binding protein
MLGMSPKLYTTDKAAEAIGISRQTLQSWIKAEKITAPGPTLDGARSRRLWTKSDIDRVKKFKGTLKPGPRSKKNE